MCPSYRNFLRSERTSSGPIDLRFYRMGTKLSLYSSWGRIISVVPRLVFQHKNHNFINPIVAKIGKNDKILLWVIFLDQTHRASRIYALPLPYRSTVEMGKGVKGEGYTFCLFKKRKEKLSVHRWNELCGDSNKLFYAPTLVTSRMKPIGQVSDHLALREAKH